MALIPLSQYSEYKGCNDGFI